MLEGVFSKNKFRITLCKLFLYKRYKKARVGAVDLCESFNEHKNQLIWYVITVFLHKKDQLYFQMKWRTRVNTKSPHK